jgi:hypothetical protein
MEVQQRARPIELLEHFKRRPAVFPDTVEVEAAFHCLGGFREAAWAACAPVRETRSTTRELGVRERGWEGLPVHPYHPMLEVGMSPEEIQEPVDMEIEVLQTGSAGGSGTERS